MKAQWNTGKRYTPEGQPIVATQRQDGSIIFTDLARGITGVLTHKSGYHGADRGGIRLYPENLGAHEIRLAVTAAYCDSYAYQDLWLSENERLTWEPNAS